MLQKENELENLYLKKDETGLKNYGKEMKELKKQGKETGRKKGGKSSVCVFLQ